MGRATRIMKTPTKMPTPVTGSISCGLTKSPSVRNITICQSQVKPSKKVPMLFLCTILALPTTNPAK